MEDKKFAMLIDSDNISSKYITTIIDEMTKYGTVTYKRIYGDWTTPQAGKWKKELILNSITPIQQFRNSVGKNATDSTMIIDAMDILYTGSVDGFCIVSSDGDFTRLAGRLRESGMDVIGMGENKTPRSFRAACSVFTSLELLLEQNEEAKAEEGLSTDDTSRDVEKEEPYRYTTYRTSDSGGVEEEAVAAETKGNGVIYNGEHESDILHQSTVENAIIQIITSNDDHGRATELGEIGGRLQKKYSDFDVRNYGYSSLQQFIADSEEFEMRKSGTRHIVRLKENNDLKKTVTEFIIQCVRDAAPEGVDVGFIGQRIHKAYPSFHVKSFGYSTLSKFISVIGEIKTQMDSAGRRIAVLK